MSLYGYKIVETKDGPLVSGSSVSIFDILLTHQQYDDFYAICVFHNLNPLQVEVALEYIKKNSKQLEAELQIRQEQKAKTDPNHRTLASDDDKLITKPQVLREQKAEYTVRRPNSENLIANRDYKILETENGPTVSESRTSVYDILLSQKEGHSFYAMCVIHNLEPLQVEAALVYIRENRERLEAELPALLAKKAENERYHRAIAAERQKIPVKMTPQRQAFYELRNRHLEMFASHGTSYSE